MLIRYRMGRASAAILLLLCSASAHAQDLPGFFGRYCHDATSKKGRLDLSAERGGMGDRKALDRWTAILDRVASGQGTLPGLERA